VLTAFATKIHHVDVARLVGIFPFKNVRIPNVGSEEHVVALRLFLRVQETDTLRVVVMAHLAQFSHAQFARSIFVMVLENVGEANVRPQKDGLTFRLFVNFARFQKLQTLLEKFLADTSQLLQADLARAIRIVILHHIGPADIRTQEYR
jgi:hypothetical protein